MTLRLVDLAPELQHSVFELLEPGQLFSLSLANKNTHAYAQHALYSEISLSAPKNRVLCTKLVLRTLLERPELAQRVQRLSLQEWGYNMPMQCGINEKKDEKYAALELDPAKVAELTSWTSNFKPAAWIESLKRLDSTDAEVAFLLSILPNLKSLSLNLNFSSGTKVLGQMLRAAISQPEGSGSGSGLHRFQNLRYISMNSGLSGYRKQKIDSNADILPFFYMPSVTQLSMPIPNQDSFRWLTDAPNPSALSKLQLHRIREDHLESVLAPLTGLRELVWTCTCVDGYDQLLSKRHIDLKKLSASILRVRDTLEDLRVVVNVPNISRAYHVPRPTLNGSLDGFDSMTRLKSISIPWVFAMGHSPRFGKPIADLIPRNIESIKFTDDLMNQFTSRWSLDSIFRVIKSWVEREMTSFSSLHTIELAFTSGSTSLGENWCNRLRLLNAQVPITFHIMSMGPGEGAHHRETIRLGPRAN